MTATVFDRASRGTNSTARARLRLFCFPYAGGSSAIFRTWQHHLPAFVDLVPVQLPGRGHRMQEQPLTNIRRLAESLLNEVRAAASGSPFAFFGHSMGAVIAFEIARRMHDRFQMLPQKLYISGRQAPHLPEKTPPTYNLPERLFIEELRRLRGTPPEVLADPELLAILLPQIRADFQAIQTYRYTPGEPLECPIEVFGGVDDEDVPEAELDAWHVHTKSTFNKLLLPGDHFFLHSQVAGLLDHISRDLSSRF